MTTTPGPPQPVPFDSDRWRWHAAEHRVEEHLGRKSLYLKGGIATVADARVANGWIEFDVAFGPERGFMGGIWRVQDDRNYEEFYLRPHQSGNPDATQYTPVFNGIEGWQLYHGKRYTVPVTHRFDEWTHVKILFAGAQAEIYIRDMEKPVLFVDGLKRDAGPGGVGLNGGDFAPAHFSNFSFTATDAPPIQGKAGAPEAIPEGVVSSWSVSDAFPESALEGRDASGRTSWRRGSGPAWRRNARGSPTSRECRGSSSRRTRSSPARSSSPAREQIKRLDFGFSDRVRVI